MATNARQAALKLTSQVSQSQSGCLYEVCDFLRLRLSPTTHHTCTCVAPSDPIRLRPNLVTPISLRSLPSEEGGKPAKSPEGLYLELQEGAVSI
jgi:hypothetical protein